jgi:hypothetical protein
MLSAALRLWVRPSFLFSFYGPLPVEFFRASAFFAAPREPEAAPR